MQKWSTRPAAKGFKVLAQVRGSTSCPVPDTYGYAFALIEDTAPQTIVMMLNSDGPSFPDKNEVVTVSTMTFPGEALTPGTAYRYALMRMSTTAKLLAVIATNPATAVVAKAAGVFMALSKPFVA